MTHAVTRFRITLVLRETAGRVAPGDLSYFPPKSPDLGSGNRTVPFAGGSARLDGVEYRWLTLRQAAAIPLSSTGRALVQTLSNDSRYQR